MDNYTPNPFMTQLAHLPPLVTKEKYVTKNKFSLMMLRYSKGNLYEIDKHSITFINIRTNILIYLNFKEGECH